MHWSWFTVTVLVLGAGLSTIAQGEPRSRRDLRVVRFYGDTSVSVIRAATRLVVHRVDPDIAHAGNLAVGGASRILGYRVVGEGVVAPPGVLARVREFVLSPTSYTPPGTITLCGFSPGVALTFSDESGTTLDLLVCLLCSEIGARDPTHDVRTISFSPGHSRLLQILSTALPEDDEIRDLYLKDTNKRKRSKKPPN